MNDVLLFNNNRVKLVKFILTPILTDYKDVGIRNFVAVADSDKVTSEIKDITSADGGISLGEIVDKDLNMVQLDNEANSKLEIDGGVSATRYAFSLVVDEVKTSGNVERIFLRGYTSAIDLNINHHGNFHHAIPEDAMFYIDSCMTMRINRMVGGNRYVADNHLVNDNILSVDAGVAKMMRPMDVITAMVVQENEASGQVPYNDNTNLLSGKFNSMSNVGNNNAAQYTRKLVQGLNSSVTNISTGNGYYGEDVVNKHDVLKNSLNACSERNCVNVPVLNNLFNALKSSKISVLSVQDIKYILGTDNLNRLVEVLEHTSYELETALCTEYDADSLGADTITVGCNDFFNSIQVFVSDSSLINVHFNCIVEYGNTDSEFDMAIINYDTYIEMPERVQRALNNFKNLVLNIALKALDKYLRFDDEVQRFGGYVLECQYNYFTDCIINLTIGEEVITFRFPNFAGSKLTPVLNTSRQSLVDQYGNTYNANDGSDFRGIMNNVDEYLGGILDNENLYY